MQVVGKIHIRLPVFLFYKTYRCTDPPEYGILYIYFSKFSIFTQPFFLICVYPVSALDT